MMIKNFIIILVLWTFNGNTQPLIINKYEDGYIINERTLHSKGKTCELFNYLSRGFTPDAAYSIKPLVVIKLFDYDEKNITTIDKPSRFTSFADYVKNTAVPKLNADMLSEISKLEPSFRGSNINQFDSLIIYDGKTYQYIPGIVLVEFFNLLDFKQLDPLQTNQTILNTKAQAVPIYTWVQDSLPIPKVDEMLGGKIFLLKKKKDEYVFYRWPFDCSDCPLTFYNEYVYKKDYGIAAFKSKYVYLNTSQFREEKIIESNDYYYFK